MNRIEALFENLKNAAERKGEPFPYNNWDEWKADEPKRMQNINAIGAKNTHG